MVERKVHVYLDLGGDLHPVGQLWTRLNRGRESASFQAARGPTRLVLSFIATEKTSKL